MIGRLLRVAGVIMILMWAGSALASAEQESDQTVGAPGALLDPGVRLPVGRPRAVAQSRSGTKRLYAITEIGLFASEDKGRHWDRLHVVPLRNEDVLALAVHPLNEGHLFVGGRGGLWKSLDGGRSWKSLPTPEGTQSAIRSIAVALTAPETIYIGTDQEGVFRSSDGGSFWSPTSQGLPEALAGGHVAPIRSLTIDHTNASIAYAGTELHGLYKTTNSGRSWVAINQGLGLFPLQWRVGSPSLLINRADPRRMMAMLLRPLHSQLVKTFVYQSSDGGAHWFALEIEVPSDAQGVTLAEDSADPERVALLTTKGAMQIQWQPVVGIGNTGPQP